MSGLKLKDGTNPIIGNFNIIKPERPELPERIFIDKYDTIEVPYCLWQTN